MDSYFLLTELTRPISTAFTLTSTLSYFAPLIYHGHLLNFIILLPVVCLPMSIVLALFDKLPPAYATLGEIFARNKLAAAFPLSMRLTGPLSFRKIDRI